MSNPLHSEAQTEVISKVSVMRWICLIIASTGIWDIVHYAQKGIIRLPIDMITVGSVLSLFLSFCLAFGRYTLVASLILIYQAVRYPVVQWENLTGEHTFVPLSFYILMVVIAFGLRITLPTSFRIVWRYIQALVQAAKYQ